MGVVAQPPYSNISSSGQLGGMAPTVVSIVFKKLGIPQLKGNIATYGNAIPGLLAGRWDVIASELDVTPARCAQVIYGNSFGAGGDLFVVPPGNPKHIETLKDVKNTGITIGVPSGASEIPFLEKTAGISPSKIVQLPDDASELADLKAGRVSAIFEAATSLINGPVWKNDPTKSQDFEFTKEVPDYPAAVSSVAFRKSDTSLRDAFDVEFDKLVKSGEFDKLGKKFGFTPEELSGAGQSVAPACKGS